MHFMAVKSRGNVLVLSFINYSLKKVHLQQLKAGASGGGGPFLSEMVNKMVSGWI